MLTNATQKSLWKPSSCQTVFDFELKPPSFWRIAHDNLAASSWRVGAMAESPSSETSKFGDSLGKTANVQDRFGPRRSRCRRHQGAMIVSSPLDKVEIR